MTTLGPVTIFESSKDFRPITHLRTKTDFGANTKKRIEYHFWTNYHFRNK